ncbi:MAG TPA: TIGR02391 family protein [Gammaproteobacteria bacterium]|nr:TIGR02391 family protein [Gammaproteobacteria bacterium]
MIRGVANGLMNVRVKIHHTMLPNSVNVQSLAGIEYLGNSADSNSCLKAVIRILSFPEKLTDARLLSGESRHCFLLYNECEDIIAVKPGFTSGYSGAGPTALKNALKILYMHQVSITEYAVSLKIIDMVESSALTFKELDKLAGMKPAHPSKVFDYMHPSDDSDVNINELIREYPEDIPYFLFDPRLMDIAIHFRDNSDNALMTAYRRLESTIRERSGLHNESGAKLFSKAFQGENPVLIWPNIDSGEQKGRASLFTATYMSHRNNRAHKESLKSFKEDLLEFFLINQLFNLEKEAINNERHNPSK